MLQAAAISSKKAMFFKHCVLPMLFGGIIYILFRPTSIRMFLLTEFLGLKELIDLMRVFVGEIRGYVPNWTIYSLPDGIWIYSLTSSLLILWRDNTKYIKLWLLFPFVFGILVEIFQSFGIFQGTFDLVDLIMLNLGFMLSIWIHYKKKENEKGII